MLQYLIRLSFKNQAIFNYLNANFNKMRWIYNFLNDPKSCIPGEKLIINNKMKDKTNHRMHMIYLPLDARGYQQLV